MSCINGVNHPPCICNPGFGHPLNFSKFANTCVPSLRLVVFACFALLSYICMVPLLFLGRAKVKRRLFFFVWNTLKLSEYICVLLFNRYHIASRTLFWVAQLWIGAAYANELHDYKVVYEELECKTIPIPVYAIVLMVLPIVGLYLAVVHHNDESSYTSTLHMSVAIVFSIISNMIAFMIFSELLHIHPSKGPSLFAKFYQLSGLAIALSIVASIVLILGDFVWTETFFTISDLLVFARIHLAVF